MLFYVNLAINLIDSFIDGFFKGVVIIACLKYLGWF